MTVPLTSMAMDKPEWLTSMEAVLEVLNEGVVITNEHQLILSVNSRFIEMTGIPKQDLTGSYASQFYSPQEWDFVARQINAGLSRNLGSRFILFGLSTPAREVLQLPRLIKVFEVYENEEQASAV